MSFNATRISMGPREISASAVRALCCSICLISAGPLPGTALADSVQLAGEIFGTSYSIKARDDGPIDKIQLKTKISKRLNEIDALMSTYRDDSDVSRFNQAAANVWFPVDAETLKVIALAQSISTETDGAFDITVGPAVQLWNFGANATDAFLPPTEEQISATLAVVGYQKLATEVHPPAISKAVTGLQIDLSAIAKGYAVDAISDLLEDIDHYMVEIGGEVRVRGTHRDGSLWRIGLEAPQQNERRVDSILSLDNESLATSGDYRNFFEHNGVTYSHTIDQKTCRPVCHNLASVTVLADNCARADALATAILAMGPAQGLAWAEAHNVRAMLMLRSGDGFSRQATANFPKPDVLSPQREDVLADNFLPLFTVTVVAFGIAILAMSVGIIVSNRRLQGSCGGMAGLKDQHGETLCDMCTKPSPGCSGNPE